ncbi:unnamed protein product [Rhizopus microsporus]|nr:Putative Copper-fist transcription factor [Rhizopus microsporus]
MLINGIKFACNTCVKGHRSSTCKHFERPLIEIRKKGRPVSQCVYCRDLRKAKQIHVKCNCIRKNRPLRWPGLSYTDIVNHTIKKNHGNHSNTKECACSEKQQEQEQQQQQQQHQQYQQPAIEEHIKEPPINRLCGSMIPHQCTTSIPLTKGESVVMTMTPLHTSAMPVTRIVTCYCGEACICPGCFVHPDNYSQLAQLPSTIDQLYEQQQQQSFCFI